MNLIAKRQTNNKQQTLFDALFCTIMARSLIIAHDYNYNYNDEHESVFLDEQTDGQTSIII